MKMSFHYLAFRQRRKISCVLLVVMISELLVPLRSLALTSGPSQPEFQGFTPLATTSLVDPFSGDFSYNIPLLEVEGYPLNLVYRATSNIEEEGSWVGYGWNINVGTLNRHVRGLPDDMNGGLIKTYQNIKERTIKSTGISMEPNIGVHVGEDGLGLSAQFQSRFGFTYDDDNYTGIGIGLSVGAGVYASINAGPFSIGAGAGVTTSVHSNHGGGISVYAGYNVGISYGEYFSVGFGKSVSRTFNTITGWEKPTVVGSFNIGNVTMEVQKKGFISSISNDIPQITNPYRYSNDGWGFNLNVGMSFGLIEELGIDFGVGLTVTQNTAVTRYNETNVHRGYGYMYAENASKADILDFTRDNDGGINKEMPYMPPAMKTYDVFNSTAHNASGVFRADRNDFGTVRDPEVAFQNTDNRNEMHEVDIKGHMSITCWVGITLGYNNVRTSTEGHVTAGGCTDDQLPYRKSNGRDQNLFFRVCGATSQADDNYLHQVNKYGYYHYDKADTIKGGAVTKRAVNPEPIAVYTNAMIDDLPQTVVPKQLLSYEMNEFPVNKTDITSSINRIIANNQVEKSKIGAILNTNKSGQTYVYATPVENNIKNEVAFRINGFDQGKFQERDGVMTFEGSDASQYNGQVRDNLYKTKITSAYATSYLLNAVLSPDYVDVTNDGITDDDLGSFVKFNYTKAESDYRWRVPYADSGQNLALLNREVKLTKFDDMGSYMIGSKQIWYAHSIESKNYVAEFYLSKREDALDSRSKVMRSDHPHAVSAYENDKDTFAHLYKLDSIKYYYKHDRYLNQTSAVPLKTVYFSYDYGISSNVPNSTQGGKLRLTKVRVRHGNEPLQFAETYDMGYSKSNPSYSIGNKDGWGNYAPNDRPIPMCEFPYLDQVNRQYKDSLASAFHLNGIVLPSGGKIDVEYEADDYTYVQNKRAMALVEVAGVGKSSNLVNTDAHGLYDGGLNPFLYIYVKKPAGASINKSFLLNNSNLMYFSFNINIGGSAFSIFDQVKGYAEVDDVGTCPNDGNYMYIKVRPVDLNGTGVSPSPMTNTAINMARAFATDQLYFQENEHSDGKNRNKEARLAKAAVQVADAILGKNSIKLLMKRYRAGHKFIKNKSYVRLVLGQPKIGGGSRVAKLTFDDEWNKIVSGESSSLIGYRYQYIDGVASYEPTLGGEENPFRSGSSYRLSDNPSAYPPYDPIELIKEDPAGESFFPMGSVGYSKIIVESIHKAYARSAQTKLVHEFYTARDFPFFSSYGPIIPIKNIQDENNWNPNLRDILLAFLGVVNSVSSSQNIYETVQDFLIETNDMHGKPKGNYTYRLLPKNGKEELVSYTQYYYHTNGNNRLSNEVDVIQHQTTGRPSDRICDMWESEFPKANVTVARKTLGVETDVCTDSREVMSTEKRKYQKRGGSLKICFPLSIKPKFNWHDASHEHVDYYKSTVTTKIVNRYGILKSVKHYKEGAETFVENKYYDAVTGDAVVQVYKNEYADNIYSTNVPGYWTKTDLEPSYFEYPFFGTGSEKILPDTLHFNITTGGGFLSGSNLVRSNFNTSDDLFHPGDEIFVRAQASVDATMKWHRLYVADVLLKKSHFGSPDPLALRYGSGNSSGATYQVILTPYRAFNPPTGQLNSGDKLYNIQSVFKYRSGRKNMLDVSAGTYLAIKDPFSNYDTVTISDWWENPCFGPSFLNPVIDAKASRYSTVNATPAGVLDNVVYNPVSTGTINQPYVGATYSLFGNRVDPSQSMQQRGNGILPNWYYWLPARYDSSAAFVPLSPLLTHWTNATIDTFISKRGYAFWFDASNVTKSIPSVGPVEETNPLGIYNSIFIQPESKKILHTTANAKFGQTWAETFEDFQQLKVYNNITDLFFSPFKRYMTRSTSLADGYEVYSKNQSLGFSDFSGSFTLDNTQSHTGVFSLATSGGSPTTIKITPRKFSGTSGYFYNLFDFNLDDSASQKFTYEVWLKNTSGNITSPSITSAGITTILSPVSISIDGWTLYRAHVVVNHNSQVTFTFPSGQYYDDLRVFPSAANVKTYVYHPFKTYLMAILDENNYATFYEYNTRNQLIRLKKETEKGIITITENIKNVVAR